MSTPQFNLEDVLESARSIRPELPELLDEEADFFDQQLADLLAQANAGQAVEQPILDLLNCHDKTRKWVGEFLNKPLLPKGPLLPGAPEFQPLPGYSPAQSTIKYVCPVGNDFTRRLRSGEPVPICRTHQVALVPVDQRPQAE
jgi:hypothetical protein